MAPCPPSPASQLRFVERGLIHVVLPVSCAPCQWCPVPRDGVSGYRVLLMSGAGIPSSGAIMGTPPAAAHFSVRVMLYSLLWEYIKTVVVPTHSVLCVSGADILASPVAQIRLSPLLYVCSNPTIQIPVALCGTQRLQLRLSLVVAICLKGDGPIPPRHSLVVSVCLKEDGAGHFSPQFPGHNSI